MDRPPAVVVQDSQSTPHTQTGWLLLTSCPVIFLCVCGTDLLAVLLFCSAGAGAVVGVVNMPSDVVVTFVVF